MSLIKTGLPGPRRAALIGVGGYGGNHLQALRRWEDRGAVKLTAVADPFEERMPDLSAQMRRSGVAWYRDHREMLASEPALDFVVVAAPIHLHEQMTLDVLRTQEARILLEKPAVPTLEQLDRLVAADSRQRVRVGFQMVHQPQVKRLREWIHQGELGRISAVTVMAGWPRNDRYYARSGWAGRLSFHDQMVFDGPATNALSHLLNNVCHLLGGGPGRLAGRAEAVSGWLARARDIESYDTFYSECRVAGTPVRALLTHAVAEQVPYLIKVRGEAATAVLSQEEPFLRRIGPGSEEIFAGAEPPSTAGSAMYAGLLGSEDEFAALPVKLEDARGYTEWTESVRLLGPTREFAPGESWKTTDGVVAVHGMEQLLRSFYEGGPPPEPGQMEAVQPMNASTA